MKKPKTPVLTDANALIDEDDASKYLAISPRTLRNWRTRGGGPRFVKISARCIRYRMRDLLEWSDKRTRRSTSDLGILR
ncbi:helix-turn-helix domain-containing protein [uncultured Maricaulis sp.]|uniref:helix-turn-helix transcriptional regulator n=1 Tax=uncultured Maricaulis sp. TaxID=174710 RepID=UPI0030DBA0B0|tara:strand:- start:7056 stop:7292 length:237 start_codon:yes stop_codon:yes gene_type:complete